MATKKTLQTLSENMMMGEQIPYELSDFPIFCRHRVLSEPDNGSLAWHRHIEPEFLYVEEGEVTCCVNAASIVLKEGDGIFINSKESHRIVRNVGNGCVKTILLPAAFVFGTNNLFYKECIEKIVHKEEYQYICLQRVEKWQIKVLEEMKKLRDYCERSLKDKMPEVIFSVCKMWETIAKNIESVPQTDPEQVMSPSQLRLQQMLLFIRNHYAEPITLADIAGAANISQSEAARCFKKNFGTAPFNYLIQYRLEVAKVMLQSGDLSITEIAMQCGFDSVSYFDRVFRKYYWLTPKAFRGSMDIYK